MNKVLITGGMGFIGLHVAQFFVDNGISIVLLDNLSEQIHGVIPSLSNRLFQSPRVRCIRGDVRDRRSWITALKEVDAVLHFAAETGTAQSMYEIELYTATNISGTALLLDIVANQKHSVRKIIIASSRSVYGEGAYDCSKCGRVYPTGRTDSALRASKWDPSCPLCGQTLLLVPTPEDSNINPASIYAMTKLAQEGLVRIAGNALGIPTVILRFQNVYGDGQSLKNPYTGILSIFSNKIRQGKPIFLYEDGQESRDFIHVQDVAKAVYAATIQDGGDGRILNVGCGKPTTVSKVAQILKQCFGSICDDAQVTGEYRIGDIRHCYADLTAIRKALGFEPSIGLESGIDRFVHWVKTQPVEPDLLHTATQQLLERKLLGQNK